MIAIYIINKSHITECDLFKKIPLMGTVDEKVQNDGSLSILIGEDLCNKDIHWALLLYVCISIYFIGFA